MENLFVTPDWFELFVAQNLVFDGLLYPLVYRRYEAALNPRTGNALAMVTGFMSEWYDETARWVDATLKTAAEESAEQPAAARAVVSRAGAARSGARSSRSRARRSGPQGAEALAAVARELDARAARLGIAA